MASCDFNNHLSNIKMSIQEQPIHTIRLCTSCYALSSQNLDALLTKPGDGRKGYSWTTTRKRLHASSTLGCPLCTIILNHTLNSHYQNISDGWANAELIARWEAGDEEMPFTFSYSQHLDVEDGSRVFNKIVVEPDKERGGKGSAIVSFLEAHTFVLCFAGLRLCNPLKHSPIKTELLLESWIRKG